MDKISILMPDSVSLGVVTLFETHADYKLSFAAAIFNQLLIMDKLQGQKKERPLADLFLKKGDNTDLRALYEKATKLGWISGWAELRQDERVFRSYLSRGFPLVSIMDEGMKAATIIGFNEFGYCVCTPVSQYEHKPNFFMCHYYELGDTFISYLPKK